MFFNKNKKPITEIQIELTNSNKPNFGGAYTLEIPSSVSNINNIYLKGTKEEFKKLAFLINETLSRNAKGIYDLVEINYQDEDE